MQFARVIHVVGNILWLGGGVFAALTMALLSAQTLQTRAAAAQAVRRVVLLVVTPGMLLSLAGGLTMLLSNWSTLYAKAPWMHGKLTVGILAAAFSGVLSGKLRRAANGTGEASAKAMWLAAAVLAVSAVAGVALVFLRPGG